MGIIDVTKKDLKDDKGRKARHGELPPQLQGYASILEEQLEMFEKQLAEAEEKVAERVRNHELAKYIMSIPGIGIGIAAALLAYLRALLVQAAWALIRSKNGGALKERYEYMTKVKGLGKKHKYSFFP
jgi:transposase